MTKISIIIPAYNAASTLSNCILSVLSQTIKDFEIILVNDCSTDNTWDIMMALEAKFPDKICIVNLDTNLGPGGARNIGLTYATGEYIGFVDSDDEIAPKMYELLYNEAVAGHYDMVDCGFYYEEKDTAIIYTSDDLTGILDARKRSKLISDGGYVFSKIYDRNFLLNSGIEFRKNCILEDCEYLMYLFATAHSIGNVKEILYNYKNNSTSSSKTVNATRYFTNASDAMIAIYNTMSTLADYNHIQAAVEYGIVQLYSFAVNMSLSIGIDDSEYDVIKSLHLLRDIRLATAKIPYDSNPFIMEKISSIDLDIIKRNDLSPAKLLEEILSQTSK